LFALRRKECAAISEALSEATRPRSREESAT
jgi:hypothetical protein